MKNTKKIRSLVAEVFESNKEKNVIQEFEEKFSEKFGVKYSIAINSGTSGLHAALAAAGVGPGDEVILPSYTFTSAATAVTKFGATPVFVDIESSTKGINIQQVHEAITPKTKAIMMAHTLGNPFDLDTVQRLCKENNLWLIEDSCDALGSTYRGQRTGSFGDTATLSFYPAHHITTGEGGAVLFKSPLVMRQIESFRDWGRDCYCETGCDNTCLKRFEWQLGELPEGYDHKYIYSHIGYNLKATDMQAALGLSQLNKLDKFIAARKFNFDYIYEKLDGVKGLILPQATPNSDPSWFGVPIACESQEQKEFMVDFFESNRIQTRPYFAGNILLHPGFKNLDDYSKYPNANKALSHVFFLGCPPFYNEKVFAYLEGVMAKW